MKKTCTKCGETKQETEFYKRGAGDGNRFPDCKVCRIEYQRNYDRADAYADNKERIEYLQGMKKVSRLGRIYTWIEHKKINRRDFREILRSVEV